MPVYPAASIAAVSSSSPSHASPMEGANPPSSPTLHESAPYFFLINDLSAWYVSVPIRIASVKEEAPMGALINLGGG